MLESYRLLLSGVAAIALLTTGLTVGISRKMGRNVLKPQQFFCSEISDPQQDKLFWTVMYRGTGEAQAWFRIIAGMEGDSTLQRRCEQVAHKLDALYPEQLQTLRYQANPATPARSAICVITAKNPDKKCQTLLILKSDTVPELFFVQFTTPLQNMETDGEISFSLDLRTHLATQLP